MSENLTQNEQDPPPESPDGADTANDGAPETDCANASNTALPDEAAASRDTAKETTAISERKTPDYHVTQRKQSISKNKKFFNFFVVPMGILIFSALRVVSVNMFIIPNNFASGGATGIGNMIEFATGFSSGWTILLVNVPLLILSFIFLNKSFAVKSAIAIAVSSAAMALLRDPMKKFAYTGNPMLAALAAGVLGGVALAIMFKIGGSSGGSDIGAMFIQKKFAATNVSWFIYAIDAVVVLVSMFVYKDTYGTEGMALFTPVLLSLLQMFCSSMVCDVISTGFKSAIKFEIVTRDPEGLSRDIIERLGRGVTCVPVKGMYSHDDKFMLVCIIRKSQLADFNRILSHYPDTFAYITNTSEVMGNGFSR